MLLDLALNIIFYPCGQSSDLAILGRSCVG